MNTSKVSFLSSSRLLDVFRRSSWSLKPIFSSWWPSEGLHGAWSQPSTTEGLHFRKERCVATHNIYDLYDENYILYNSFRPFLSSSEVQNLQNLQGFCPGLHLASENFLKILASLSFSSSDLHFFLERTEWPSKPKGQVHFSSFSFPSLCSLAPPCAENF